MTEIAVIGMPTPRTSSLRRFAAVLLVAAAAYVLAGAIPTLSSMRRARPAIHPTGTTDARHFEAQSAGMDAEVAADSARHHVVPVPGHPGRLVATDRDYRVLFDAAGFSVVPTGSSHGLAFALRAAERGGHDLGLIAGPWKSTSNGAERAVGPGMREVVSVRAGEVEWDVILTSAPAGRGDLVLTTALAGAARSVTDAGGLRVSLTGGGRVRIGALVVKDAIGRVLHRGLPKVEGRRLQLVVPGHVLAGARYPLNLDPTVGPEKIVSASALAVTQPDIAFDGTNYLVVWADLRNGNNNADIYGARVRTDGTVLDPGGFPISTAASAQVSPVVAYYGPHYLVVWQDARHGASNVDIYASNVTTAGRVLDTGGAPFSTAPGNQMSPDMSINGTSALVVWEDDRSGGSTADIYGSRWNSASGLQDPAGIPISTAADAQHVPAVSYYGPNYLVVWQDYRSGQPDIYGTRVTTGGVVLDNAGAAFSTSSGGQYYPDLAFDGTYELVVWEDDRSGLSYDIYGARWDPATGLVDPGGLAISTAANSQYFPAVAVNGGFLVLWQDGRTASYDVYGTRMADNGSVTDANGFLVTGGGGVNPAITKGGNGNWATSYERGGDVFLATIAPK